MPQAPPPSRARAQKLPAPVSAPVSAPENKVKHTSNPRACCVVDDAGCEICLWVCSCVAVFMWVWVGVHVWLCSFVAMLVYLGVMVSDGV